VILHVCTHLSAQGLGDDFHTWNISAFQNRIRQKPPQELVQRLRNTGPACPELQGLRLWRHAMSDMLVFDVFAHGREIT
jgi:hypothetical protein